MSAGKTLVTVIAVIALSGCGSGNGNGDTAPEASPSATSSSPPRSPSPTTSSKAPEVSEKTTCDLLFARKGVNPMSTLLDFMSAKSVTLEEAHEATLAIRELREIAETAVETLASQIVVFADYAQEVLDASRAGDTSPLDDTAMQAAGREITNTCQPYY